MEWSLHQTELRGWVDKELSLKRLFVLRLVLRACCSTPSRRQFILNNVRVSTRSLPWCPLDLTAFNQNLLFLAFCRCDRPSNGDTSCPSVAYWLWVVVEWGTRISLKIAYWWCMRTGMLMVFFVRCWRNSWTFLGTLDSTNSNPWWALPGLR